MKIDRKKLNKALAVQKNIVANRRKYSNAAHTSVLVSANEGQIEIRSCDGQTRLLTAVAAETLESCSKMNPIVLDFRELSKICKLQKTPDVELQCCDDKIIIDGVTLNACIKPEDFPSPKLGLGLTREIEGAVLHDALEYVLPAVAEDNSMRFGCDVVRVVDDKIVATDAHRLHMCENVPLGFTASLAKNVAFALVEALKKTKTSVSVASKNNDIAFRFENDRVYYELSTEAIDLPFPAYEQVLPRDDEYVFAKIESSAIEKLDRISKLCKAEKKGHTPFCRATFNGNLVLDALDCGSVVFRETVALNFLKTLDEPIEFSMGLNPKYLIAALDVSNAEIGYKNAYSPIIVRAGNTQALIMPVRL